MLGEGIHKGNQDFHVLGNEIATIRNLIHSNWDIHLFHTLRERERAINVSDYLAKLSTRGDDEPLTLSSPPLNLQESLL